LTGRSAKSSGALADRPPPAGTRGGLQRGTSAKIGRRALHGGARLVDLPSSSPANAAIPLAEARRWLILRQFLD
jgi:hypothetical protein